MKIFCIYVDNICQYLILCIEKQHKSEKFQDFLKINSRRTKLKSTYSHRKYIFWYSSIRCVLNLQITCADKEYCPDPCAVATRARKSPKCISPAADNARPFRRTETDSSIPFSASPLRNPVRCEIKYARDYANDSRSSGIFGGQVLCCVVTSSWRSPSDAYGSTRNSYHFRKDIN